MTSVSFVPRYAGPVDARSVGTYAERATRTLPNYEGQTYYQTDTNGADEKGSKIYESGAWIDLTNHIHVNLSHIEEIATGTLDTTLLAPFGDGVIPAVKITGGAVVAADITDFVTQTEIDSSVSTLSASVDTDIATVNSTITTEIASVNSTIAALRTQQPDVAATRCQGGVGVDDAKVETSGVTTSVSVKNTPSTDLVEVQLAVDAELGASKVKLPTLGDIGARQDVASVPSNALQSWDEEGAYLGRKHVSIKMYGDFRPLVEGIHYTVADENVGANTGVYQAFDFSPSGSIAKGSTLRFGYDAAISPHLA